MRSPAPSHREGGLRTCRVPRNVKGVRSSASWYRWAVAVYDRLYRFWWTLDKPVGPVLRAEVRRSRCTVVLSDGTCVRIGDPICVLHLNNDRVCALHVNCPSAVKAALEFRRQFVGSLRELARLTEPGGRLIGIQAFEATTIFHQQLRRIGCEPISDRLRWSGMVAFYQRALTTSLHPASTHCLQRATYRRAERLWLSRARLLTVHQVTTGRT